MNRRSYSISRSHTTNQRARRQTPLERIGAFLDQHNEESNAALLRRMRESYFADVDALEKSGAVKLPK